MDGTLTVGVHDFDAMRAELGLPDGAPILETIESLETSDASRATSLRNHLAEIELRLARESTVMAGALQLLGFLAEREARVGILTRNNWVNTRETLAAVGLDDHFDEADIVTRDCTEPKPSPAGIRRLLERWGRDVGEAVMVGDYVYDLQAGRAAGVPTVYLDVAGAFPFADHADWCVPSLGHVLEALQGGTAGWDRPRPETTGGAPTIE